MAVTRSRARWSPVVTLTALATVSGAVSASPDWARPLTGLVGIAPELVPVLVVGVAFGLALGLGLWLATARLWALPVVLTTTLIAWGAAIQVAIRLQRTADDDPHLIAASLAAGAVGAGIAHLGCAVVARPLRRPLWIALTCVVGALAGMVLYASRRSYIDAWAIYLLWQPAVAFSIGLGLSRARAAAA
jgi:hypothetical protein